MRTLIEGTPVGNNHNVARAVFCAATVGALAVGGQAEAFADPQINVPGVGGGQPGFGGHSGRNLEYNTMGPGTGDFSGSVNQGSENLDQAVDGSQNPDLGVFSKGDLVLNTWTLQHPEKMNEVGVVTRVAGACDLNGVVRREPLAQQITGVQCSPVVHPFGSNEVVWRDHEDPIVEWDGMPSDLLDWARLGARYIKRHPMDPNNGPYDVTVTYEDGAQVFTVKHHETALEQMAREANINLDMFPGIRAEDRRRSGLPVAVTNASEAGLPLNDARIEINPGTATDAPVMAENPVQTFVDETVQGINTGLTNAYNAAETFIEETAQTFQVETAAPIYTPPPIVAEAERVVGDLIENAGTAVTNALENAGIQIPGNPFAPPQR